MKIISLFILNISCIFFIYSCARDCTSVVPHLSNEDKEHIPYQENDTVFFIDQNNKQYYLTCYSRRDSSYNTLIKSVSEDFYECKSPGPIEKHTDMILSFHSNLPCLNNTIFNNIEVVNSKRNTYAFNFISTAIDSNYRQIFEYRTIRDFMEFNNAYSIFKDSININGKKYYNVNIFFDFHAYSYQPYVFTHVLQAFYDSIYYSFQGGFLKFVSVKGNYCITKQ